MADEAYQCAKRHLSPVQQVFHQDTPAQGQRLAARLIRQPAPEIARLGPTTQMEGRILWPTDT